MNLGETEPTNAFGGYPFDPSAVCVNNNPQPRWQPVSKLMAPCPGDERRHRALVPSPPPLGNPSSRANWPPSIRREEARVLSNLKRRVGFYRVRNTSTFKILSPPPDRGGGDADDASSSTDTSTSSDLDNRIFLRKMLSNRPLNRLSNINDTNTDWYTSDFVTECLCWHNVYRQRHGCPPLSLASDLCSYAQEWANTLAHMNIFFYRPHAKDVGQNIYCRLNVKDPGDVRGHEVASYWYRACRRYDFMKEPDVLHANVNAGYFTQLVWAGTSHVGIGIARSRTGKVMVVANYRPAGNVPGQFQDNVFPPILECDSENGSGRG